MSTTVFGGPQESVEHEIHFPKVNILCALGKNRIFKGMLLMVIAI